MQTRRIGTRQVSAIGLGAMPMSVREENDAGAGAGDGASARSRRVSRSSTPPTPTAATRPSSATTRSWSRGCCASSDATTCWWRRRAATPARAPTGSSTAPATTSTGRCRASLHAARGRADRPLPAPPSRPRRAVRRDHRRPQGALRRGPHRRRRALQRRPGPDPGGARHPRRRPGLGAEPVLPGVPLVAGRDRPLRGARAGVPGLEPAGRHVRRARRSATSWTAFAEVADKHGVSPQQVCLAWELALSPAVDPDPRRQPSGVGRRLRGRRARDAGRLRPRTRLSAPPA